MDEETEHTIERLEIQGLDRHGMEALRLAIRRLARRHGVEIQDIRVESGRSCGG